MANRKPPKPPPKAARAKPARNSAAGKRPPPKAAALPPTPPSAGKRGHPPHVPTQVDRDTVSVMVAGGIGREDIARARGISVRTLQKHYKLELATGTTALNTIVIIEHVKRIKAGEFQAIKWWQQARMGWTEHIVVDDGKPADTPLRVVVEFMGEPAAPRADQAAPQSDPRGDIRKTVKLVG